MSVITVTDASKWRERTPDLNTGVGGVSSTAYIQTRPVNEENYSFSAEAGQNILRVEVRGSGVLVRDLRSHILDWIIEHFDEIIEGEKGE